jgi:hypothetical protein
MSEVLLEALPLARSGYCCSQILMKLVLDAQGVDNPGLLRAMHGLCRGLAFRHGACGLLTGGICTLSYLTGKGGEDDEAHLFREEIRYKYLEWFKETVKECGGTECFQITRFMAESSEIECASLLSQCWEKLLDLLEEYGIDPSLPPSS